MIDRPLPTPVPSINQVTSLVLGPCAVPAYALVGLAVFDAIEAIWSIFSPNWKDTIKEGPGRKSWLHQLEMTLDEGEEVQPTWFIDYKETSYFLFEFFDLVAFWFMVGYVSIKGLLDWSSMVWRMSPCFPQRNNFYIHSKTPDGVYEGITGGWQLGPVWFDCTSNLNITELAARFTIPANASASILCAIQYKNDVTNLPVPMDVRITDGNTGIYWQSLYNAERKHDAKLTSGLFEAGFTTDDQERTYQVEVRNAGGSDLIVGTVGGNISVSYTTFG